MQKKPDKSSKKGSKYKRLGKVYAIKGQEYTEYKDFEEAVEKLGIEEDVLRRLLTGNLTEMNGMTFTCDLYGM